MPGEETASLELFAKDLYLYLSQRERKMVVLIHRKYVIGAGILVMPGHLCDLKTLLWSCVKTTLIQVKLFSVLVFKVSSQKLESMNAKS